MSLVEELQLGAGEHSNVLAHAWLRKRHGKGLFTKWNSRYVVVASNFLYTYVSPQDTRPRKVVGLDGCRVEKHEPSAKALKAAANGKPSATAFAFTVTSRAGRETTFATETLEVCDKWVRVIAGAGYEHVQAQAAAGGGSAELLRACGRALQAVAGIGVGGDTASTPVGGAGAGGVTGEPDAAGGGGSGGGDAETAEDGDADGDGTIATAEGLLARAREAREAGMRARSELAKLREAGKVLQRERDAAVQRAEAAALEAEGRLSDAAAAVEALTRERDEAIASAAHLRGRVSSDKGELLDALEALRRERDGAVAAADAAREARLAAEAEAERVRAAADRSERALQGKLAAARSDLQMESSARSLAEDALEDERSALADTQARLAALADFGAADTMLVGARGHPHGATTPRPGAAADGAGAGASPVSSMAGRSAAYRLGAGETGTGRSAASLSLVGSVAGAASPLAPSAVGISLAAAGSDEGGGGGGDASRDFDEYGEYEQRWTGQYRDAVALERAGRYEDAERQYMAVYETRREREGTDSVAVATAARDVGRTLALQRRYKEAARFYGQAVELCARLLGEAHPNTACALTDLAAVVREQGKYEEAEGFAQRAVTSLRRAVGDNDASTATALYNLAGLAKRQGKYLAAEKSYAQALDIFGRVLGDDKGETADTLYQMGCLYRKRMLFEQAGHHFALAANSYAKAYGETDRRVEEATRRAKAMASKLDR